MEIQKIEIQNKNYPKNLKEIKNPPKKIYTIGNQKLLLNQAISIIGSRSNTEYGKLMALNFAKTLSKKGYTIISGLAKGIDTYSHIGAMLEKGKTIAILPCGFNQIYPKQNQQLYEEIITKGGLAITEYEPNEKAESTKFPERNRIVAALSKGILIIEGAYRSGTKITANQAKTYGKPIFCIPSNITNNKGRTPNQLIKEGNIIVTNEYDIINKIQNKKSTKNQIEKIIKIEENIEEEYINKIRTKNKTNPKYTIYKHIKETPIYINDIVTKSKKDISEVNYELTMLILEGYIEELEGKTYIRKK